MNKRNVKLSASDQEALEGVKREGLSERLRDRSQALLLSNKGFSVKQLAEIFNVRQGTILDWYNRWEQSGLSGLGDMAKSGRPRIFGKTEEKKFY